jgi:GT2 family glycosyltransferase
MFASVIVLNWNGWKDTIECIESVWRLDCSDVRIVVCDNASTDGSVEKIKEWARGDLLAHAANSQLSHMISPACPKPVPFLELTREEAESGTARYDSRLVLIQNGSNFGFGAGCNVGLRYALGDTRCQFFWLLNNDTVVAPGALSALIHRMQQQPAVGICGSLNLSYFKPTEVQAQGGMTYRRWMARATTPKRCTVEELDSHPAIMDYVNGASMLTSRAFLERVGLLEESYFLYFEELDWTMRAKGRFELGYARESVIYHKEGAVSGSSKDRKKRSLLSDKFLCRNRVLFSRRFFPWAVPSVLICVFMAAAFRLFRGDWKRAKAMVASSFRGLVFRRDQK